MKAMSNKLSTTIIAALLPLSVFAQDITINTNVTGALQSIFQNLDKSNVTTGYLSDQAFDLVGFHLFNGSELTDSNYVDINTFRDLFLSLNTARVSSTVPEFDANDIVDNLLDASSGSTIALGAALVDYNYILEDALTNNRMTFSNGKAYNKYINGILQNPYGTAHAFLFTPSIPVTSGLSVSYYFNSSNTFWGNVTPTSSWTWSFDPGDNGGYRSVPSSGLISLTYAQEGTKELKLKVTLPGGTTLESHSFIYVKGPSSTPLSNVTPDWDNTISGTYYGDYVSAVVSCKIAASHNGRLVKPFIYVEGFDDPILSTYTRMFQSNGGIAAAVFEHWKGNFDFYNFYDDFSQSSFNNDYDLIYVDWQNPRADIRANAALFEDIIEYINARKASDGCTESNVVIGHSMGGLIARYALAEMEKSTPLRPHQTRYYISYDAPHLGANVPVGAQYVVRDLYQLLYDAVGDSSSSVYIRGRIKDVVDVLDCKAARQMMYNYIQPQGTCNNNEHNVWQGQLTSMGFPQGYEGQEIENIAITNGGVFDPGDLAEPILDVSGYAQNCLIGYENYPILSTNCVRLNFGININRDDGSGDDVSSTVVSYSKFFPWNPTQYETITVLDSQHTSNLNAPHYDFVGASCILDDTPFNNNIILLHVEGQVGKLPFVPVASALGAVNYSRDYYVQQPVPHIDTPFDATYVNEESLRHDYLLPLQTCLEWLDYQLSIHISGPNIAITNDQYYLVGTPASFNEPIIWSIEGNGASINPNTGVIDVAIPDVVTVVCKICSDKNCNYLRKKVLVGIPDMVLSSRKGLGASYIVEANCTSEFSSYQDQLDSLANNGVISYIWGIKPEGVSLSWCDTTSTRTHIFNPPYGELTKYYMKMRSSSGGESQEYFIEIDRRPVDMFSYDPKNIAISRGGEWFSYTAIPDWQIINPKYFAIWKNPANNNPMMIPTSIQIGNETLPLYTTFSETIDGQSVTVYCFDLYSSQAIQDAIDDVTYGWPGGLPRNEVLTVKIMNNLFELQTVNIPLLLSLSTSPLHP